MKEVNPIAADLEVNDVATSEGATGHNNIVADIATALETILSEEHFAQKTNITSENEDGLICIEVLQAHFQKSFKYEFPSLKALAAFKPEYAVSVGGYRSAQIVEIFKSMQTNIVSGDTTRGLGNRLLGR